MARFGKYTKLIYILLAIVVVQFIGLGSLLISGSSAPAEPDAPASPESTNAEQPPDWLAPPSVEETDNASAPVPEKEPPEGALTAGDILAENRIIAHGLGAVDGIPTLNCQEGFLAQYQQGVRVFEVDLRLTRDLQVVLRHDWRFGWQEEVGETAIPTLEEFLSQPIQGKYTPMSFRDLLELMEAFPDICIITDTKFTDAEVVTVQFEAMVDDAKALGLSYLFDRMVVQVYSQLMFQVADGVHHFPYYIYTLYAEGFGRTEDAFRDLADFCVENHIMGITMWDTWWREAYAPIARERDLLTFAHTVNDPEDARQLIADGIHGIYTDDLTPDDLEEGDHTQNSDEEGAIEDGTD